LGSPWENPYVESFNGRVRDELLNVEEFGSLTEAQVLIEAWRVEYNTYRLHSALDGLTPVEYTHRWTNHNARYLRTRDLQREINEGLNVVESWNRANSVIFYGKGGDIATNRRDEQETAVLCLRILQAAMVYVNTLMLQDVLADPDWAAVLNAEDQRGLTPLFWTHVLPYGEVRLDMTARLTLGAGGTPPAG
jgi:hypothetical protein